MLALNNLTLPVASKRRVKPQRLSHLRRPFHDKNAPVVTFGNNSTLRASACCRKPRSEIQNNYLPRNVACRMPQRCAILPLFDNFPHVFSPRPPLCRRTSSGFPDQTSV